LIPNISTIYIEIINGARADTSKTPEQSLAVIKGDLAIGEYYISYGPTGYQSAPLLLIDPDGDILFATWAGSSTIRFQNLYSGPFGYGSGAGTFVTLKRMDYKYRYGHRGGPFPPGEHDLTGRYKAKFRRPYKSIQYPWTMVFGEDDKELWRRVGVERSYCRIHASNNLISSSGGTRPRADFFIANTPGSQIGYPTHGCIRVGDDEIERFKNAVESIGGAKKLKKFIVTKDDFHVNPSIIPGLDTVAPYKAVGYFDDRMVVDK